MAKPKHFRIDSTPFTAVAVCLHDGCSWRGMSHSKPSAYRQVGDHMARAHDDAATAKTARSSAAYYNRVERQDVSQRAQGRGKVSA